VEKHDERDGDGPQRLDLGEETTVRPLGNARSATGQNCHPSSPVLTRRMNNTLEGACFKAGATAGFED
jgi:hypothetical protein